MPFNFEQFGEEEQNPGSLKGTLSSPVKKEGGFDFESFGDQAPVESVVEEKKPGVLKSIGSALISSEKEFGEAITQAIAGPLYQKEAEANNKRYLEAGRNMMILAEKTDDPIKKETYMNTAQDYFDKAGRGIQDIMGEIKTTKQVIGSAAGVALDIATAGTYGAVAKGAKTGQLLSTSSKIAKGTGAGAAIYQKAISQVPSAFKALSSQGLKEAAKKTAAGSAVGYSFDIASNLQQDAEGLAILKPGYGALLGGVIPVGLYGMKAGKEGVKKGISGVVKYTADLPEEAVADYLLKTKKIDKLIKDKVSPQDALEVSQGAVRNLRKVMTKEWQSAVESIKTKYPNRINLDESRVKQLTNIVEKFGDDVLNKTDDMGNITQINPASMSIDDSLSLLKNVNELYSKRIVRESAEGMPVRSFKDFFKNNVIENFGGKKGEVANLYSNYSSKKGILDAANDIVNAYQTGRPIKQATALGRIKAIYRENKGAYLKAIKDLEEQTGVNITSYITASELGKGLTAEKIVTAGGAGIFSKKGILDRIFEAVLFPITTPKYARYILRATKPKATTVIGKASKSKGNIINKMFPQKGKEAPKEVLNTILEKTKKIRPGLTIEDVSKKNVNDIKKIYLQSIANEDFTYGGFKGIIKNGKLNPKLIEGRVNDVSQKLEKIGINPSKYQEAIKGKSFKNYFEFDKANREIFAGMIPGGSLKNREGKITAKSLIAGGGIAAASGAATLASKKRGEKKTILNPLYYDKEGNKIEEKKEPEKAKVSTLVSSKTSNKSFKKAVAIIEQHGKEVGDWMQLERDTIKDLQDRYNLDKSITLEKIKKDPSLYDKVVEVYKKKLERENDLKSDYDKALWLWRPSWFKKYKGDIANIPENETFYIDGQEVKVKKVMQDRKRKLDEYFSK